MAHVTNLTKMTTVVHNLAHATGFWKRAMGLMFTGKMEDGEGLLIENCSSIHTCFMRYAIDVIFVNDKGFVIKTLEEMKPFGILACKSSNLRVLELPQGTLKRTNTTVGDHIGVVE